MIRSEHDWLESARALVLRSDFRGSKDILCLALNEYPASFELRRAMAGVCQHLGEIVQAERLFEELHTESPQDEATSFELARLLMNQGRMRAMASVLLDCMRHGKHHSVAIIRAVEMLDDGDRIHDAATICEQAIAETPLDPRLHAYAGMLFLKLGEFARARGHYLFALHNSSDACEWRCPLGLANTQRYLDDSHPDFAMFRGLLEQADLSDEARATLLFALGKAHDDIADYPLAAQYFRQGNLLCRKSDKWSRKSWHRAIEARIATHPHTARLEPTPEFTPIFIVGMPRSGTTLVAEILSQNPLVRNRGEPAWIAKLAQKLLAVNHLSDAQLQNAAQTYVTHIRRDDPHARWFIDKHPLNFRYVDLILALFPNAKIIHCQRNARDTALSLWMQWFVDEDQNFAYDFKNIATVMDDCIRLMALWHHRFSASIHTIRYEQLARDPAKAVAELTEWLELPAPSPIMNRTSAPTFINTASLWQARQPIYTRSVGRWRSYAAEVPELMKFSAE